MNRERVGIELPRKPSRSALRVVGLGAAIGLLACRPSGTAEVTASVASPGAHAVIIEPASCPPTAIDEVLLGLTQVRPDMAGGALAAGLARLCSEPLDPQVRKTLTEVMEEHPDPSHVAALPPAITDLIELSDRTASDLDALRTAYD